MRHRVSIVANALLSLCIASAASSQGVAQDQPRAPLANSFGRFWGVGWSAGYHARTESRFGVHRYMPDHNVVPQPVRGAAATQHLGSPYSTMYPGNAPVGYYHGGMQIPMQSTMGSPMMPGGGSSSGSYSGGNGSNSAGAGTVPAPKPVEPPPSWLKQYIKPDGQSTPSPSSGDNLLDEASPSDRRGVYYQAPGISILQ